MSHASDDPLRNVEPRGAPAGLRARALVAARTARMATTLADPWTRIWTSRPLRIAWAASLAAVLLAHVAVSLRGAPHPAATDGAGGAFLIASTVSDDELRALVDLPSISTDTLPTFDPPTLDPHG